MENNLNQEIIEHLMHPRNYGPLKAPTGIGVGHSERSGEFVMFYIKTEGEILQEVGYATNGCQDTVVLGSMFTEMIKGESLEYAQKAAIKLRDKVSFGPAKQQACADMVLTAFEAALIHERNCIEGSTEELYAIEIDMECEVEE
ncbi:MAG: iron-sulfur cluster assembly scaffold protein [Sulfuricurvum sp.]|uniref:iron-sulfur cluster assembly scaffold protein n=1 Tax=Sulfuricurvum sp. TaxID=2025608 RepID=UPI0026226A6B|nr:iron-sulfur cluster assembly scaffold protein [Sulfuricurvum sp.]MDD5158610.1 iron-sulfur cluster assembly scaffold protein [Sulfuricurvum sp.]MDD5160324.1 iron-sulfur cluster assembly scaffold protein [Sulfuricurvum sp.]